MPDVFINEFHYDDASTDSGEFIEIAGLAGTDLTGWQIVRYNGTNPAAAVPYTSPGTISLSGVIPDSTGTGWGFVTFNLPQDGLQNGTADGFALVDNLGNVVELISYEGVFTAASGVAAGLTSTDVGVAESGLADGTSVQRVGTFSEDSTPFTWQVVAGTTPTGANTGQTFVPVGGGDETTVSIDDVSIAEGDAGTQLLTFTVTRSDADTAFTVDVATADGTATVADGDYDAFSDTLTFAVGGALTQTVSVTINGDVAVEPNEAFTVALSNLVEVTGDTVVTDDTGVGTINTDDIALTRIYDIQGAAGRSPLVGQTVTTRGIVTAIDAVGTEAGSSNPRGFYIQDATGDGDYLTSDAVFVFLGTGAGGTFPPDLEVGDEVQFTAVVSEFLSGQSLPVTQLGTVTGFTQLSEGNALPTAVRIGDVNDLTTGLERRPELVNLGDDDADLTPEGGTVYDPVNQGADFWESLEGMRVVLEDVRVTSAFRSNFDEQFVTPNVGANASENDRGGLTIRNTTPEVIQPEDRVFDFNPERIQLDDEAGVDLLAGLETGDLLGDVTGVVNFANNQWEVNVTEAYGPVTAANLTREVTAIEENLDRIRVATFNVENLAPVGALVDGVATTQDKFDGLADAIIGNLKSPEIIALQEVLDNDGAANTAEVSASETLSQLIETIVARGGPRYIAIDSPPLDDDVGGIPGGNQRVAYLFNPEAVSPSSRNGLTVVETDGNGDPSVYAAPTASQIGQGNSDFDATRGSLPIEWAAAGYSDAQGGTFFTINNHFSSKGGSAPLYGQNLDLPLYTDPLNGSAQTGTTGNLNEREGQAEAVNAYIDGVLADASATNDRFLALGDFNDFQFFPVIDLVTGELVRTTANPDGTPSVFAPGTAILSELIEKLPVAERYSYNFDGNAQALDHILASNSFYDEAFFDIVHINSEFAEQISDHDPSVSSLVFLRSAAIATEGADVLDQAAFDATFTGVQASRADLTGGDVIDGLGGNDRLFGYGGDDTLLGGAGGDKLKGQIGADDLEGGAGADKLQGGDREDTLDGGVDRDRLTGGVGADRFVFSALGDSVVGSRDRILDFDASDGDVIDVRGIDAIPGGADDAFSFVTDFTGAGGELRVRAAGVDFIVDIDLDGDTVADFSVRVTSDAAPIEASFVL